MIKFNKVMLVDDDEVSNFITTEILSNINLTDNIEVATNGKEALEILTKDSGATITDEKIDSPDLIFLDLNMPVMNGFEFLQAFRDCDKKVHVVVLTSSTNEKDIEEARKYPQVKYYLSKPLTADKVERAIGYI